MKHSHMQLSTVMRRICGEVDRSRSSNHVQVALFDYHLLWNGDLGERLLTTLVPPSQVSRTSAHLQRRSNHPNEPSHSPSARVTVSRTFVTNATSRYAHAQPGSLRSTRSVVTATRCPQYLRLALFPPSTSIARR